MAYILGFLYADGNIVKTKRDTHFVAWYTADKDLLEIMKSCIDSNHKISLRSAKSGAVYRMQIGSAVWFTDLHELGLRPNKTKRLRVPKIPGKFVGSFVRGYFDGDGNVWVGAIHKERNKSTMTIQVAFTSCSLLYLKDLQNTLHLCGLKGGSIYTSKTKHFSRLSFSVRDALLLYEIMYNTEHKLFLNRKKRIFEKFINNCGGSSTG